MNKKKKNKINENTKEFLWDKNSPEFDKIMKNYFLDTRVLHINEKRSKSKKKNKSLLPSDYFDKNSKNNLKKFFYETSKNIFKLNDDIKELDDNETINSTKNKINSSKNSFIYNYSYKNCLKEYEKELPNSKKIINNNYQNLFAKEIKHTNRQRNKSTIISLPKIKSYQINDNLDDINQNNSQMIKQNNSIKLNMISPKNNKIKLDLPKTNKKMIKINLIRINKDFSKIFQNTLKLEEENSKKIQKYFDKKNQLKETFNYFKNKFF